MSHMYTSGYEQLKSTVQVYSEHLVVAHVVNKFPRFVAVFIRSSHCILS